MNYDLFGGRKWPGNWASRANIQHTSKSSPYWHVHKDWCATSGKFFRKLPKTGILTYLGAQSGPKIGPLRPIFSTRLKVLGMSMWSNTVVKPVKTFWESDQTPEIFLLWAQKFGLWGPYFTLLWIRKPEFWLIWRHKMAQNLGLWCLSFTHLQK